MLECIVFLHVFAIRGYLWGSFWIPGATHFGSFFVKFCGGSPGSFLDAFWSPFGCLLGALGTFLEDFASILAALETFVGLWAFGESLASFFQHFRKQLKDVLSGPLLIQVYRLPRYPFSVIFLNIFPCVFCTRFCMFIFDFGVF